MKRRIEKIARTGYAAKGVVYCLTGGLTFLAAFNLGGQKAGQLQVLEFLEEKPFGNILLILVALGIACYAVWRFTQAFSDPENIGSDTKGKFKRLAFFLSGCSYLLLGYLALQKIMGSGGSGQGSKNSLLMSGAGLVILGVAGLVILGRGLYQFYRAYNSNFTKKLNLWYGQRRELVKKAAVAGVTARGILFVIIGYFVLRAAVSSDPSKMKDTREAFSFIQDSDYGSLLLGLVALGAVGYGIYMFMVARYREFM